MGRPFDPGDAHPIYAMIKVRPIPPGPSLSFADHIDGRLGASIAPHEQVSPDSQNAGSNPK